MKSILIQVDSRSIVDKASFHEVFSKVMGFPNYYGRNMDAWIDCMTYVDDVESGMTKVTIPPNELLVLQIMDSGDFHQRLPELHNDLVECSAFVNSRRTDLGKQAVLALLLT